STSQPAETRCIPRSPCTLARPVRGPTHAAPQSLRAPRTRPVLRAASALPGAQPAPGAAAPPSRTSGASPECSWKPMPPSSKRSSSPSPGTFLCKVASTYISGKTRRFYFHFYENFFFTENRAHPHLCPSVISSVGLPFVLRVSVYYADTRRADGCCLPGPHRRAGRLRRHRPDTPHRDHGPRNHRAHGQARVILCRRTRELHLQADRQSRHHRRRHRQT